MKYKFAVVIWLLATFFAFSETSYFGWNMVAKTDAEVICDGIALLIFALALIAAAIAKDHP